MKKLKKDYSQKSSAYLSKLPRIVAALKKGYKPEKIILFGSMLKPNSLSNDIDLFLIKNTTTKRLGDREREAREYLEFNDVPLDLIVYTPQEVEKYRATSVLLHQIAKGKVLYG